MTAGSCTCYGALVKVESPSSIEIQAAAAKWGIDPGKIQLFKADDPFNPGVGIEGVLSLKPDHTYGSMLILRVDGAPCEQMIRATPKLRYPFDRCGKFNFPLFQSIHFYEKLDGTNILSYCYDHPDGHQLTSHKLRLAPFVRNGRWGGFLDMWKEMLARRPQVVEMVARENINASFEMYGGRNEHLVSYDNGLDVAFLFGVDRERGGVVPPHDVELRGIPSARLLGEVGGGVDPVDCYAQMRATLERSNRKLDSGKISGSEGSVWYLGGLDGGVSMWKCKPESVEEVHWATGICKSAVMATCWNALESVDALDYAALEPLLLEEYQADDILKFRKHIDDCVAEVNNENAFREKAKSAYEEVLRGGLDLKSDKGGVMRALSRKFPREQMTKVYGAISK